MRIWHAIADYMLEHNMAPAVRDIQAATGSSTSVIHYTLDRLDERGYIQLAQPTGNSSRPARSFQLLVWPMACAEVPEKHKPVVRRSASSPEELKKRRNARRKPARRKQKSAAQIQRQPRKPFKVDELPDWWLCGADQALVAELDVEPRTLRVILSLGAKTVHEAAMLLKTRPAQVRNLGIEQDLRRALAKFARLKEAS
jgi:hypothetical protein